jgi:serine/threonine protein kinase
VGEGLPEGAGRGSAALAVGSRIAGYLLEEEVGAGGMAVVFRARDERLGRPVALKVLAPRLAADEEFHRRFLRESRAAAAVDDPHIIPVFELLGGGPPFERDQDVALIWAHLSVPPPSLASRRPDLPSAVDEVPGRALAKAPGDRYSSCREFAGALRQALGLPGYDSDPGAVPAGAAEARAGHRPRRSPARRRSGLPQAVVIGGRGRFRCRRGGPVRAACGRTSG